MSLRTGCGKGFVALTAFAVLLAGCGGGSSRAPAQTATGSSGSTTATSTTSPQQTTASDTTQPSTAATEPLRLNLAASPAHVERGGISTLSWDATPATRCTAADGWQGEQPVSGVFTVGPVEATTGYELHCENVDVSSRERVTVTVVSRTLRWRAPTHNVDGSPLTDLAGYVIYWGLESFSYTHSHRLESPSATEWELETPPGSYYISMTAFDTEGNESTFSNEVLKVVP